MLFYKAYFPIPDGENRIVLREAQTIHEFYTDKNELIAELKEHGYWNCIILEHWLNV